MTLIIWHNPRCSKSRQTLALLEESGQAVSVRKYLEDTPSRAEIEQASAALGLPVSHFVRRGEKLFKELGLKDAEDEALLTAMVNHPILIERPIVFKGETAVIGRPPEAVKSLL